ncbi:hypothetical protein ACIQVR_39605 [Streptomyces xanthochromogenes]|uniref:hypothetical protein n=1 Tax=Streptomyces xanthochromogenes TaxID=67384 RepID=UPI00380DB4FD
MGLFSRKTAHPMGTPQGMRNAAADAEKQAEEFRAKGDIAAAEVCETWAAKTRRAANDSDT